MLWGCMSPDHANNNGWTQLLPTFTNFSCSGTHSLLNISSKPTLHELDKLIVVLCTINWEQVALCLGVESCLIDRVKGNNPGQSAEACQAVLNTLLNSEPGTGVSERTWHSVSTAMETSGHGRLAEQLKRVQFGEGSEWPNSRLTSPLCVYSQIAYSMFSAVIHTLYTAVSLHSKRLILGAVVGWHNEGLNFVT